MFRIRNNVKGYTCGRRVDSLSPNPLTPYNMCTMDLCTPFHIHSVRRFTRNQLFVRVRAKIPPDLENDHSNSLKERRCLGFVRQQGTRRKTVTVNVFRESVFDEAAQVLLPTRCCFHPPFCTRTRLAPSHQLALPYVHLTHTQAALFSVLKFSLRHLSERTATVFDAL